MTLESRLEQAGVKKEPRERGSFGVMFGKMLLIACSVSTGLSYIS